MADALFKIVSGQNNDDVLHALITVMTPMFIDAPEPRGEAVRYVLRRMEVEILARLPEVTELLTGQKQ